MERPIIKIPATRGDTFGYPLPISNDVTSTIRIHLRKTPDAVNYFILSYIDGSVVIPDTITSQLSGAWFFDVEITSEGGIVRTLPNLYEIDFSLDVTRVYGNEAPDGTSDFERNLIIAKEYQVRLPNGEVSTVLTSDDLVAMEALVDQSAASADAALVSEQHAKISEDNSKTEADISTAQAVISAAKADIATAQANIAIAQATISTNQAVISTAKADIATAKAQLASDKADVATAQAVIATAQADIATAQANIAIAQATISTNQAVISTAQAVISTDQATISTNQAAAALASKNAAGVSETNANFSKVAAQASADLALYYALQLIAQGIPKGSWNATTNTPTLANGTGTVGWWYMCAVGGTVLGYTWNPGDAAFYNGTTWVQIPAFKSIASLLDALTGTENAKFITPQSLLLFFLMNALPYQNANDDLNMGAFNIAANQLSVKGYLSVVQSLTYSTTINFDFTSGSDGIVTLTGNVTFAMSNVPDKSSGTITTIQGSGGSKLLTSITHTGLTVVYRGGVATLTTTAGKSDKIRYERNGTILYVTLDLNY